MDKLVKETVATFCITVFFLGLSALLNSVFYTLLYLALALITSVLANFLIEYGLGFFFKENEDV